ncbi:MAG: superoxide dismutase family protein [Bdellovibrionaceae bacterium]|nr:superoxide dismutase family protein [Pseudobdellovibrionaceae bacterium]
MNITSKFVLALSLAMPVAAMSATKETNFVDMSGKVVGTATAVDQKNGVKISVNLSGLEPGKRGMHIHAAGKCEGPKFESAADHFNPTKRHHGKKSLRGPHLGDLGNVEIAADGTLKKDFTLKGTTLNPGTPNSLATEAGTSIIIHANPDDEKSDPSGHSGDRIYCAVLTEPKTVPAGIVQ